MNPYPPLKALVAFDAAMRTGSFSLAAAELFVTPGAVGQQIQKLEEWLGVALFMRQVRQVQPTEDALGYWKPIQPALAQIAAIPRIHFDQSLMAIEAARQGQGLVVTSPQLVEAELAEGSLVEPFAHALALTQGYHLVHPRRLPLRPAVATVKQWLIDAAGRSGGAAGTPPEAPRPEGA